MCVWCVHYTDCCVHGSVAPTGFNVSGYFDFCCLQCCYYDVYVLQMLAAAAARLL